ncbi:hypothetical protein LIER_16313 [Lithospermum erythrorhizon]|uniref:Uncharacterized protein n=1 Tax=Lithospermum erythrorhizon TaxID=34254 RepID=A0AAV3Q8R2_LITER
MEEFVFTLKAMVGTNIHTEAEGIDLDPSEIVEFSSRDYQLSTAMRADSLVLLVHGVQKFSGRRLVKGKQYSTIVMLLISPSKVVLKLTPEQYYGWSL